MRHFLLVALIVICSFLVTDQVLFAQSFSELSVDTFKTLSKGGEKHAPSSPFSKAGVSTAEDLAIDDLVLTGIAVNPFNAYALISGYLVEVGDRIAGFKVDSIEKGRVTLRRLDETYVLTIGGL